jgi:KUP system potassium uptake protein
MAPRRRGRRRAVPPAVTPATPGVVFGDIGTSPLYALQTVFSIDGGAVRASSRSSSGRSP